VVVMVVVVVGVMVASEGLPVLNTTSASEG